MKLLGVTVALAMEVAPFSTSSPEVSIHFWATFYGADYTQLYDTLKCESGFNPKSVGDHGTSFGVAQIHLSAHSDITKAEALDPNFSVKWAAEQFSLGREEMWTCWRMQRGAFETAPAPSLPNPRGVYDTAPRLTDEAHV